MLDTNDEHAEVRQKLRTWMQRLRKRHGFTQRQLAKRLDVHYVTVAQWERGKQLPIPVYQSKMNFLAMDVRLEPMPKLPKPNYGPKGPRGGAENGASAATTPTPQTADLD